MLSSLQAIIFIDIVKFVRQKDWVRRYRDTHYEGSAINR